MRLWPGGLFIEMQVRALVIYEAHTKKRESERLVTGPLNFRFILAFFFILSRASFPCFPLSIALQIAYSLAFRVCIEYTRENSLFDVIESSFDKLAVRWLSQQSKRFQNARSTSSRGDFPPKIDRFDVAKFAGFHFTRAQRL